MPLKVMTWIDLYPRKLGTLEEYCLFLSQELASRGHSSLLAFSQLPPDWLHQRFHSVGAETIAITVSDIVTTGREIIRTVKRYGVDIIHGTFIPIFSLLNLFMRASSARKVIFSDQVSRHRHSRRPYMELMYYAKNKILTNLIDLIIADAEYIERRLVVDHHVNPARIVKLYNGVNLERFKPNQDPQRIRREFNITPETSVVTTIAWAIPEKGLDTYLRAAREVLEYFPKTLFILVGDGPLINDLKQLAIDLDIARHIVFAGLRNDTHEILAATDIACLLSTWEEAFSFSMLEAMASGKPLVASRVGAIPEAVEDGVTGFLVPSGNHTAVSEAILKLLADRRLLRDMGNTAREKCEKQYDIRMMVRKTVDIYEHLVARP